MLLVLARAFARTARNCFHQKPNDTQCESKILRYIYVRIYSVLVKRKFFIKTLPQATFPKTSAIKNYQTSLKKREWTTTQPISAFFV